MSFNGSQVSQVIFAQPDCLPDVGLLGRGVVVLDIAFAVSMPPGDRPLSHPRTQQHYRHVLEKTTLAFIEKLGKRLVLWVDHHTHRGWQDLSGDPRFLLKGGDLFPACTLLLEPPLFANPDLERVDTLVCHPDVDGLLSAARFLLKGKPPYPAALQDAVAADTRNGPLTPVGRTLDLALKGKTENIPAVILEWLVGGDESKKKIIGKAAESYQRNCQGHAPTSKLYRDVENCRILDVRGWERPVNMTETLCDLQKENRIGVVIDSAGDRDCISVAGRGVNLPGKLDLPGGSRSRVRLDAAFLPEVVERLAEGGYPVDYPKRAMVEIVRRCNLACPLCPVGNGRARQLPDMDEDAFQCIVDAFGPHLESMTLHNYGEPLLHPRLTSFIRRAKSAGIPFIDLSTNGHVLSADLARDLVETGLDCIRFSVDTSDSAAYVQYRKNGCLERVLTNLETLADIRGKRGAEKPYIEAQALLMRDNEREAHRFERDLLQRGADRVRWKTFNIFMSGIELGEEGKRYLPVRPDYHRYAHQNPEPADHRGRIGLCTWPWDRLVVLADGTIVPCCHDYNGDHALGRARPGEKARAMWKTAARKEFMIRRIMNPMTIPMCRRCSSAVKDLGLRKEAIVPGKDV